MKCDVCLEQLEEYLDGELLECEASDVAAHLMRCHFCSSQSAALISEQEMFARYNRELEVSPYLWDGIAERTIEPVVVPIGQESLKNRLIGMFRAPVFAFSMAAVALIAIALVVVALYADSRRSPNQPTIAEKDQKSLPVIPEPLDSPKPEEQHSPTTSYIAEVPRKRIQKPVVHKRPVIQQSDVLSSDLGYGDLDDRDTVKHLEQTENLLRSVRNIQVGDSDQVIDVSYDKALSRRLLNENIVLRRDAEMRAKFPAKTLLSDLEPFLIDIANLPDQARPEEVRAIKERVRKTEIVAALLAYND